MITCQDTLFDLQPFTEELPLQISEACVTGTKAEIAFGFEAAKRGFSIWLPWGHAYKADVIVWKYPSPPLLVQVKTATKNDYGWRALAGAAKPSCAQNPNDYGPRYMRYQQGDFHVLAMYVPEVHGFRLYTINEVVSGPTGLLWKQGHLINNWNLLDMLSKELT